MKKQIQTILLMLVCLFTPASYAQKEETIRERDIVILIDQSFKERSKELTFTKDISFFEVFTIIFEKDIGFIFRVDVPGDFTDSKRWEIKAKAVSIDGNNVIKVVNLPTDKENIVKRMVDGVEKTTIGYDLTNDQGSHVTFYFQFKYKGKKKSVTVPWDFKVGTGADVFETKSGIKYKINVKEVR